jgi:ectoine hydroxylase-related dioxygenase (phytanoyl-CoA dioxygenase family)
VTAPGNSAPVGADTIEAYRRDGAAVVRGVIAPDWIARKRTAIDRILAAPGRAAIEYTPEGNPGRYYGDFFLWMRDADFEAFMRESGLPELAAAVMGARSVRFFYDQLLVKEPNTAEPTPWHQDLPYWSLRGGDILSIWVPFDPVTVETGAVVYLKGSHLWGRMFAPNSFGKDTRFSALYARSGFEPVPDIEAERDRHAIAHWDLAPGDVVLHHPLVLHYAAGNASPTARRRGLSLRYVGDDCVWDARPGTFMDNAAVRAILPSLDLADGDALRDPVFPRVWPR